jgi:hypothetical protein
VRKSSVIVFVLLAGFTAFLLHSLFGVSPVTVIGSHLQHEGDRVFVIGQLKNTSSHPAAIDLEVHYFDRTGRAIGQNTLNLDAIPPGSVRQFKTPAKVLNGVADFSLYLNHGRNPYGN